jgi:hypothetical protein
MSITIINPHQLFPQLNHRALENVSERRSPKREWERTATKVRWDSCGYLRIERSRLMIGAG